MDITFDARLLDLKDGNFVCLAADQPLVLAGLTVQDKVICVQQDKNDADLVISLCKIQRKADGHWIIPSRDLPCLLNDVEVTTPMLLSQGSTIKIGDRYLRYNHAVPSKRKMTPGGSGLVPPPKPKRLGNNDALSMSVEGFSFEDNNFGGKKETEENKESSLSSDWCIVTSGTLEEELLEHLKTPQEVANLAASYICRQLTLFTDILMSSNELDHLFKVMQATAEVHENQLITFVSEYIAELKEIEKKDSSPCPVHGPVIHLLTELLKVSLEPLDQNILWMKLLNTFSHFSQNTAIFLKYQTAAIVMGTMAAHSMSPAIQQHACSILAQLATYSPLPGVKGPVRESGIELATKAMLLHRSDMLVLRPACRTLANITTTYSNLTTSMLDSQAELSSPVEESIKRALDLLDFMKLQAIPTVKEIMVLHQGDLGIHTECRRILAFFADEDEVAIEIPSHGRKSPTAEGRVKRVTFHPEVVGGSATEESDFLSSDFMSSQDSTTSADSSTTLTSSGETSPENNGPLLDINYETIPESKENAKVTVQNKNEAKENVDPKENTSEVIYAVSSKAIKRNRLEQDPGLKDIPEEPMYHEIDEKEKKKPAEKKDFESSFSDGPIYATIDEYQIKNTENNTAENEDKNQESKNETEVKVEATATEGDENDLPSQTKPSSLFKRSGIPLRLPRFKGGRKKNYDVQPIKKTKTTVGETGKYKPSLNSLRAKVFNSQGNIKNMVITENPMYAKKELPPIPIGFEESESQKNEPKETVMAVENDVVNQDKEKMTEHSEVGKGQKYAVSDIEHVLDSKGNNSKIESESGENSSQNFEETNPFKSDETQIDEVGEEVNENLGGKVLTPEGNSPQQGLLLDENQDDGMTRRKWSSVVFQPDTQALIDRKTSVTDSIEWATWMSCCDDFGEVDPEVEEELRINRTLWKSVIAELKDKSKIEPLPDYVKGEESELLKSIEKSGSMKTPGGKTVQVTPNDDDFSILEVTTTSVGQMETSQVPPLDPTSRMDPKTATVSSSSVNNDSQTNSTTNATSLASKGTDTNSVDENKLSNSQESEKSEKCKDIQSDKKETEGQLSSNDKNLTPENIDCEVVASVGGTSEDKGMTQSSETKIEESKEMLTESSNEKDLGQESIKMQEVEPPSGDILAENGEVCRRLQFRKLLLKMILDKWNSDHMEAVEMLNKPIRNLLKKSGAPKEEIDMYINSFSVDGTIAQCDPSLAVCIMQALSDVSTSADVGMKLMQYTSTLLDAKEDPSHLLIASQCIISLIQGPLASNIKEGWGFFTLRTLHKKTETLIRQDLELDSETVEAISSLHSTLDRIITYKS